MSRSMGTLKTKPIKGSRPRENQGCGGGILDLRMASTQAQTLPNRIPRQGLLYPRRRVLGG